MKTKTCKKCKEDLSPDSFHRDASKKDGLHPWCRACKSNKARGYYQRWTEEQRTLHRSRVLSYRYGIGYDLIRQMYQEQEGCCAICGDPGEIPAVSEKGRRKGVLHVDHDHTTGKVRSLLCSSCNKGLGLFRDDHLRLIKAANYLISKGWLK